MEEKAVIWWFWSKLKHWVDSIVCWFSYFTHLYRSEHSYHLLMCENSDPQELAFEWACANELLWSVIEMVLEGVMPFDLKANILISEQALGEKITIFGLSVWHFLVPQFFFNIVILKGYNWSNTLQGNRIIIVLKSFMFLWSHLFFFKCCSSSG